MKKLLLVLAMLFVGCSTHTHVGDCASCSGFVLIQDQVHDGAQTTRIFTEINRAMNAQRASVAPVGSSS